jgi:hypothetical protein
MYRYVGVGRVEFHKKTKNVDTIHLMLQIHLSYFHTDHLYR